MTHGGNYGAGELTSPAPPHNRPPISKAAAEGVGGAGKALNWVAVAVLFSMMMLTVADVVGRYVLNNPIPGAFELSEFMMVAVVFLPLAFVQLGRGHVRVELLLTRLPFRAREAMEVVALLAALGLYGLITWYGLQRALLTWGVGEHTIGLVSFPLGPPQMLVPVGGAILCLQFLVHIVHSLRRLVSGRE